MAKVTNFQITYPLKKRELVELKLVTLVTGELLVQGTFRRDGEDDYSIAVDHIRYKGLDIKNVLEVMDKTEDISAFCLFQAPRFFENSGPTMLEQLYHQVLQLPRDSQSDAIYFDEPVKVLRPGLEPDTNLWAIRPLPNHTLLVMDINHVWHPLEETEADAMVIEAVRQKIQQLTNREVVA